jgi:hypothetical protein
MSDLEYCLDEKRINKIETIAEEINQSSDSNS